MLVGSPGRRTVTVSCVTATCLSSRCLVTISMLRKWMVGKVLV